MKNSSRKRKTLYVRSLVTLEGRDCQCELCKSFLRSGLRAVDGWITHRDRAGACVCVSHAHDSGSFVLYVRRNSFEMHVC